jgi:phage replication O-like protein O
MPLSNLNQDIHYTYTRTPNDFLDVVSTYLRLGETRVVNAIIRKTIGWNKAYDQISISQFEKITRLDRTTICRSIKSLEEKKIIVRSKIGVPGAEKCYYAVNMDTLKNFLPSGNLLVGTCNTQKKPKSKENDLEDLGLVKREIKDFGLDPLAEQLLAANVGLMIQQISNKQQPQEMSLDSSEIEAIKTEASEEVLKLLLDKIIEEVKSEDIIEEKLPVKNEKPKQKAVKNNTKHNFKTNNSQSRMQHNIYSVNCDITKRFKLTNEQIEKFEFLKSQKITYADKSLVTEEKLCYLAKMDCNYQRLVDIVTAVKNDYKADSEIAYIKDLINKDSIVPNNNIKINKSFAEDFALSNKWHQLKINKNYATFNLGNSVQEINFNMKTFDFIRTLTEKYENSIAYG